MTARQLTGHHAARVTLTAAGLPLAALDTGGGGPVLLMLPGYTGAKEDFAPLLDPLSENGFRAIAVDLPGQFESPGPDDEAAYSVSALADVVVELLAGLPAGSVLLGHSFGGLVARSVVLAGVQLSGLLLLSSGPDALPDGPRLQALSAGEPVLREHGNDAAYALRAAVTATLRAPLDEPLEDYFRTRFLRSSAAGLLGMGTALRTEPDRVAALAAALAATGTPVAVVTGEADDAWTPAQQADMARRLGTSLTLIPGAAHSAAVEQPDALLRLLIPLMRTWTSAVS